MARHSAVLVVSASAGSGHLRAAEALRSAWADVEPTRRVEHVDILSLAPRWVRTLYGGGFELVAARAPWIWRRIYSGTDGDGADMARWAPLARKVLFRAFRRLAGSGEWQHAVCTHFLPCQLGAGRPGFPGFSLVVTDFALHRYWVQPRVERYFVATESIARELRRRGTGPASATGIPVADEFGGALRSVARTSLGLDADAPVALIMGGGLGLGVEDAADAAIGSDVPGLRLLVVCGKNRGARDRLLARRLEPDKLRVLGRVSNVAELMAAADVIISKPGGLTTSEALAVGRPLVLTPGIPGHEEGNARWLSDAGAAVVAPDGAALAGALRRLLESPGRRAQMATAAARLGRPHAAYTVVQQLRAGLDARAAA